MFNIKELVDKFNATHKTRKLKHYLNDNYDLVVRGKWYATIAGFREVGLNHYKVWNVANHSNIEYATNLKELNAKVQAIIKVSVPISEPW